MNEKIKGLVIWASSDCRSMLGLYDELRKCLRVDVVVALCEYRKCDSALSAREKLGFKRDEFGELKTIPVGEDWQKGVEILDAHKGYRHLFSNYQKSANFRRLMVEASNRGERVGVVNEAPSNSLRGFRRIVKQYIYFSYFLRWKVRDAIAVSDFILNLSGDDTRLLRAIGWEDKKILPFGYFPPPLQGSACKRHIHHDDFHILASGIMEWRRGVDVLVKALALLKRWNISYRATITQKGPMYDEILAFARKNELPINFCGFLALDDLIKLYEECSVYVAAGRSEPWGMRINDALQCGAPLLVCRGMGGVQIMDEYRCGFSFAPNDYVDLAHKLRRMIEDVDLYNECANNAYVAASRISPNKKVIEMVRLVRSIDSNWL